MQIAIDGPAGAGKTSVAREVARRMNLKCLDTGAMYRAITYKALKEKIDVNDGKKLGELVRKCNMEIEYHEDKGTSIILDGEDVTEKIRISEVNKNVSLVAKTPEIRKELVLLQKKVAEKSGGIVMEGRDIGTKVLPEADYKFFLLAGIKERANRRWLERNLKESGVLFDEILEEIAMRDRIDQEREESPLKAAPEAYVIDTTSYSLEEVIGIVLNYILDKQKTDRDVIR